MANLNANQVLFILYVQECLNLGIGYSKTSALSWVTTRTMAPWKNYYPAFFIWPNPLGPSYGSPSADWDNLVENNLLPTVAQQPPALTQWVRNQTGKN
jgi:hypothetical protein